jgi:hypothetical protein
MYFSSEYHTDWWKLPEEVKEEAETVRASVMWQEKNE